MTNPNPTIMLVDDDQDLLHLMKASLENEGYVVETRTSAPSNADITAVDPALIFMDVCLNDENGAALCHALKHSGSGAKTPVILISGQDEDRLHQEAATSMADGCISKPFNMRLVKELANLYGR